MTTRPKTEQIEGLDLNSLAITGEVRWVAFAGAAPSGWLVCDGSAVSQATYPDLYAALGTTWGPDAGGNFTLPDLRGLSPLGAGTGSAVPGLSARSVGDYGGSETHSLTAAETGPHTHSITDPGHLHNIEGVEEQPTNGTDQSGLEPAGGVPATVSTQSATTGITVDSAGSGDPHNTMHPFAVLQPIIKT